MNGVGVVWEVYGNRGSMFASFVEFPFEKSNQLKVGKAIRKGHP